MRRSSSGSAVVGANPNTILLAGLAGMVAGSMSMVAGEYISVRSQTSWPMPRRRLNATSWPNSLRPSMRSSLRSSWVMAWTPAWRTRQRQLSPGILGRRCGCTPARVRYRPENLPPPWIAAVTSLASFAVGALLPLLPFLVGAETLAVTGDHRGGTVRWRGGRGLAHSPPAAACWRPAVAVRRRGGRIDLRRRTAVGRGSGLTPLRDGDGDDGRADRPVRAAGLVAAEGIAAQRPDREAEERDASQDADEASRQGRVQPGADDDAGQVHDGGGDGDAASTGTAR